MTTNKITDLSDCPKIDGILNDPQANYLADLFLARYEITDAKRYRYFKNAVLAFSRGKWDGDEIFDMLAKAQNMTTERLTSELRATINDLPEPVHVTFNRHYAPSDGMCIRMNDSNRLSYIFGFLGYAFLTIILYNYPIYDAVRTLKK